MGKKENRTSLDKQLLHVEFLNQTSVHFKNKKNLHRLVWWMFPSKACHYSTIAVISLLAGLQSPLVAMTITLPSSVTVTEELETRLWKVQFLVRLPDSSLRREELPFLLRQRQNISACFQRGSNIGSIRFLFSVKWSKLQKKREEPAVVYHTGEKQKEKMEEKFKTVNEQKGFEVAQIKSALKQEGCFLWILI